LFIAYLIAQFLSKDSMTVLRQVCKALCEKTLRPFAIKCFTRLNIQLSSPYDLSNDYPLAVSSFTKAINASQVDVRSLKIVIPVTAVQAYNDLILHGVTCTASLLLAHSLIYLEITFVPVQKTVCYDLPLAVLFQSLKHLKTLRIEVQLMELSNQITKAINTTNCFAALRKLHLRNILVNSYKMM
jgi:hypothetical protein